MGVPPSAEACHRAVAAIADLHIAGEMKFHMLMGKISIYKFCGLLALLFYSIYLVNVGYAATYFHDWSQILQYVCLH